MGLHSRVLCISRGCCKRETKTGIRQHPKPLLCINTRIPGPSPKVLFVSLLCLAAECQQPNASTVLRAPGASAQPGAVLPGRQRLCISQSPWERGIESLAANAGSPGRDEGMRGLGGLHAASALGGFCCAQPREMGGRKSGYELKDLKQMRKGNILPSRHPPHTMSTAWATAEPCTWHRCRCQHPRDPGSATCSWAPSRGQLLGVLQPNGREQAEAPNPIFPQKGTCKRFTLQDQDDHLHYCAHLILCHTAVKPHISTDVKTTV